MALHTGEAHERAGDYFGPALNRAARLRAWRAAARPSLSQATAEIVHDRLPPGTELVELGRRQLRGLTRPENVFERGRRRGGIPGDTLVAVYGLPRVHEDDASSAGAPRSSCARRSTASVRSSAGRSACVPAFGSAWVLVT